MPSVTKVKVVPPYLTQGSVAQWVRTNTGALNGGGSSHPTSPSSNIRLPIMKSPTRAFASLTTSSPLLI